MKKFLNLCEQFDPQNTEDPKWKLIDFLKSRGVNVSMVRGTDMLYIDTGETTIAVNVSIPEEEAESINAGTGTYEIDKEVENLGNKANSGLKGMAAKMWGTPAQKAKTAVRQRQRVAGQAVDAYSKGTERIKKGLQSVKQSTIRPTY
jgi:hypothetical protein